MKIYKSIYDITLGTCHWCNKGYKVAEYANQFSGSCLTCRGQPYFFWDKKDDELIFSSIDLYFSEENFMCAIFWNMNYDDLANVELVNGSVTKIPKIVFSFKKDIFLKPIDEIVTRIKSMLPFI